MITVNHSFTNPQSDGTNASIVRPTDWNASHIISGSVVGALSAGTNVGSGTIQFANSNNVSFGMDTSGVITASYASSQFEATSNRDIALGYPTLNASTMLDYSKVVDLEEIRSFALYKLCSGLISGGNITINASVTSIDIALGRGHYNDHTEVAGSYGEVSWTAKTAVAMAGNGTNYIAINKDGSADVSLTRQAMGDHVYLGHAFVVGGYVLEVFNVPDWSSHFQGRVSNWMSYAAGSLVSEGLTVSEKADPDFLQLNIASGRFYARLGVFDISSTSTFSKMYNNAGAWTGDGTAPNQVNTSQWNNTASGLVSLNTGYWKKDLLLVAPGGNVYYIYGQSEYTTEDLALVAPIPTIPIDIREDSCFLIAIVSQQGDTSIATRIHDIRPNLDRVFGYGTSSSGGAVDHGTLNGLDDPDHPESALILTDVTTNDVNTSRHGFFPKLPNNTSQYWRADGWATLAAGGGAAIQGSGTYSQNTGTIQFANSNGITFGLSANGVMTASIPVAGGAQTGISGIAGSGASTVTAGTVQFANSNGLSFGLNGSTMTASHNGVLTANQSQFVSTSQSSLFQHTSATSNFAVSSVGSRVIGIAGSNASTASGNIQFANSNGLTFGLNGSTITGSHNGLITAAQSDHSHGNPTLALTNLTGTTASASNGLTISLSAAAPGAAAENNWITLGGNVAGNSTASGSTIQWIAGANITLSGTNGSQVQIVGPSPGGGGAATLSWFHNNTGGLNASNYISKVFTQNNSISLFPLTPGNVFPGNMTINTLMMLLTMSNSTATASSAKTLNVDIGLYTINGSSLSLLNSVRSAMTHAAAASNSQSYFGLRYFTIASSLWSAQPSLTAGGNYYVGIKFSSAGQSIQTAGVYAQYWGITINRSGTVGSVSATNTSCGFDPFAGVFTATSANMPSSIGMAQINKQSASANIVPQFTFNNRMASF